MTMLISKMIEYRNARGSEFDQFGLTTSEMVLIVGGMEKSGVVNAPEIQTKIESVDHWIKYRTKENQEKLFDFIDKILKYSVENKEIGDFLVKRLSQRIAEADVEMMTGAFFGKSRSKLEIDYNGVLKNIELLFGRLVKDSKTIRNSEKYVTAMMLKYLETFVHDLRETNISKVYKAEMLKEFHNALSKKIINASPQIKSQADNFFKGSKPENKQAAN